MMDRKEIMQRLCENANNVQKFWGGKRTFAFLFKTSS